MTVGDRFDVGLDDGLANLVVSWTWLFLLFCLKDGFSLSAGVKRSTTVQGGVPLSCEILARSNWIGQFV